MVCFSFCFFKTVWQDNLEKIFYVIEFICRSDPTENDSVEGLRPNARGPGLVTFGVCPASLIEVHQFNLIMIVKVSDSLR